MPKEITKHKIILDAIESLDLLSELAEQHEGHFKYELDLEVIAYGRNYSGKKVGPYLRLFEYQAGEEIIRQGDWGGNTFYVVVDGTLDVYVADETGRSCKIGAIAAGQSFGEASILAGVPRNATVAVPPGARAVVFEVARPALRLLRKLPRFGGHFDLNYRTHGRRRTAEVLRQAAGGALDQELLKRLDDAARFMTYGRLHVLFQEGEPVDRIIILVSGWLRRARAEPTRVALSDLLVAGLNWQPQVDFLGPGNCLGLEGVQAGAVWEYTATVLQRTEVLEISVARLRADPKLINALRQSFFSFQLADDEIRVVETEADRLALAATEREIATGIVDGTNLLVMDMDLCVRCGNCSLACHQVHGQSRLLRRGIHIERPKRPGSSSPQHVLSPSVCMHCQDPECLTGCPTGAIGRFSNGEINIDPKTCIGCSDCANQCPYNAITMVPRKPPPPPPSSWAARVRERFSFTPTLPPPVTEIENVVAAACNLCAHTPLNPVGAKKQVYSCELNCPTGALARVAPEEYFTEAGNRVGPIFRKPRRVVRRFHGDTRLWHAAGLAASLLTVAAAWVLNRYGLDRGLDSTALTLRHLTGLLGFVYLVGAAAYGLRKQVYRRRAGHLRTWRLAHAYLGVMAALLLLLAHGTGGTGNLLTAGLAVALHCTLISGLFGGLCYILCPRLLTRLEGQPLLIEDLRARRAELLTQLQEISQHLNTGANAARLRKAYDRFLHPPFLLRQYIRREELSLLLAMARAEFNVEAGQLDDPEARRQFLAAVEALVTLRRVDALIYVHQLLRLWLIPHVGATLLLLVLTSAHVLQVIWQMVR